MALSTVEKLYHTDCRSRNLSPRSIELNQCAFNAFGKTIGDSDVSISDITVNDIRLFLEAMLQKNTASTAARYYDTLKAFFGWCVSDGFIDSNPMQNIRKPKYSSPIISPLSNKDIEILLKQCGKDFVGIRNRLIIGLLFDTGLRASEFADLLLSDVILEQQLIMVRHGKGDKPRIVPYGNSTSKLLILYLAHRGELDTDHLLVNCYGEPVERTRIRTILVRIGAKAGIKITTHLLRHSCAVAMLRNGCDVFTVQKMLGHQSLSMTRHYSRLADSDVQDKHRLYSPTDRIPGLITNKRKRIK
ncbi:MAG: tyrosine-type recombinase/integrase [Armatimonadota bacterium]